MTITVQAALAVNSASLYTQMLADIYSLTNRPDLTAETAIALRKATMKAHLADFWHGDMTIVPKYVLPTPVTDSIQSSSRFTINLVDPVNFPLIRKIAYIKEYINPAGQAQSAVSGWDSLLANYGASPRQVNYVELNASSVIDDYNVERTNCWYQAGKQVLLRTYLPILNVVVGYYAYPNVTPAAYNSWIAAEFPDLIVEEATASVFRVIGKAAEAQVYAANWQSNLHPITMAQIVATNR